MSQNDSELVSWNPAAGSITTTMLHSCQMMNPRNSAKIDQPRLRRAMARPDAAQNVGFSAFQPSIQRPGRWVSATGASAGAVVRDGAAVSVIDGVSVVVMAPP